MRAAPAPEDFAAADALAAGTAFQCTLCGLRFTHGGRVCGTCPLGSACDLVRCPRCGFQTPRGSRLVAWWRRVTQGRSDR